MYGCSYEQRKVFWEGLVKKASFRYNALMFLGAENICEPITF